MKPFDLEKALAGEPVVTRDGRPVKIAGCNNDDITVSNHQILGWVGYGSTSWNIEGKCWQRPECDLFMAEKPKVKKEGWVLINKGTKTINDPVIYMQCDPESIARVTGKTLARIEWEEEASETPL